MENKGLRIGLDIDGILSDFGQGVIDRARQMGLEEHFPANSKKIDCWDISEKFNYVMANAWLSEEFWAGLKPLVRKVPFNVVAYITARPISSEVTKRWLDKHGFPEAEVITVSLADQKVAILKELELDLYCDDLISTVKSAREAGINAILFAAPYQTSCQEELKGLPLMEKLEDYINHV